MGSSARSSLLLKMKLLLLVVVLAGLVSGMDVGKGGVYDSPMAQDYYVKRFGFMFGGGRSGMYGQDHLLLQHLQQVQEPTPAEGQAHGGARPQEDGKHLLQHLHGCPLTHVPNLPVTLSLLTSSVNNSLLCKQVSAFNSRSLSPNT